MFASLSVWLFIRHLFLNWVSICLYMYVGQSACLFVYTLSVYILSVLLFVNVTSLGLFYILPVLSIILSYWMTKCNFLLGCLYQSMWNVFFPSSKLVLQSVWLYLDCLSVFQCVCLPVLKHLCVSSNVFMRVCIDPWKKILTNGLSRHHFFNYSPSGHP